MLPPQYLETGLTVTFSCIWHCGDDHVHGRVLLSQLARDSTDGQCFLVLSDKDFTRVQFKLYIRYLWNFCKKGEINTFLYTMPFLIVELEPACVQLKILVQVCIYYTIGTMKRCSNNYKFTQHAVPNIMHRQCHDIQQVVWTHWILDTQSYHICSTPRGMVLENPVESKLEPFLAHRHLDLQELQ